MGGEDDDGGRKKGRWSSLALQRKIGGLARYSCAPKALRLEQPTRAHCNLARPLQRRPPTSTMFSLLSSLRAAVRPSAGPSSVISSPAAVAVAARQTRAVASVGLGSIRGTRGSRKPVCPPPTTFLLPLRLSQVCLTISVPIRKSATAVERGRRPERATAKVPRVQSPVPEASRVPGRTRVAKRL